ncbi:MAG: pentapeptide repeat-containing protein [Alphaproteobacteria bacterium]
MTGADLKGTNFAGADLRRVNFTRADLSGTNFKGAARLSPSNPPGQVKYPPRTAWSNSFAATGAMPRGRPPSGS